jgi:hypothetical protein
MSCVDDGENHFRTTLFAMPGVRAGAVKPRFVRGGRLRPNATITVMANSGGQ